MNPSELAEKMLTWEQAKRDLDALEVEIKAAVLDVAKTQTVGNVKATYNSGRKSYDYQEVGEDAPPDIIEECTTTTTKVDWRKVVVAWDFDKDLIPFKQSDPSVTLKLTE